MYLSQKRSQEAFIETRSLPSLNERTVKLGEIVIFGNFARIASLLLCGFSSWYIAWLLFLLRRLAKFEYPACKSNKTFLTLFE